jgi:CubicO group peptidase (beta-lactamase class C family)
LPGRSPFEVGAAVDGVPDQLPRGFAAELPPLPTQPAGVPWPHGDWPRGNVALRGGLAALVDEAFSGGELGPTYALLVVHAGKLVLERYDGALELLDRPPEPVGVRTHLLSWSMAKSVLHAIVGILVAERHLAIGERAAVPLWSAPDDPRRAITIEHLMTMRDGLDFLEEYVPGERSDVIEMLFGEGQHDVAAFAADRPLAHPPGHTFRYSSGTTNILSGVVARVVGAGEQYRRFLDQRLFRPVGMSSAKPGFDDAGTWVASSNLHATAQDYARFGLLYLRDGTWDDRRILPVGWVDHGRRPRSVDPEDAMVHGAHWWVVGDGFGTFRAAGYQGQAILVVPDLDAVIVRLGKTPLEHKEHFARWRAAVVPALADAL